MIDSREEMVQFVAETEVTTLVEKMTLSEESRWKKELTHDGKGYITTIGYIKDDRNLPVSIHVDFWRRQVGGIDGRALLATWTFCGAYADRIMVEAFLKKRFPNAKSFADRDNVMKVVQQLFEVEHLPSSRSAEEKKDFEHWYDHTFLVSETKGHDAHIPHEIAHYCITAKTLSLKMARVLAVHEAMDAAVASVKETVDEPGKEPAKESVDEPAKESKESVDKSVKESEEKLAESKTITIGEFQYRKSGWLGRNLISIDRERDQLYITIGIRDWSMVKTTGKFYLVGTNGSLKDVLEAVKTTSHLWR